MQLLGGLCHMPFDEAVGSLNGKKRPPTVGAGRRDATAATGKAPFQTFVQLRVAWEEDEGPDLKGQTLEKNSHSRSLFFFFWGGMVKGRVGVGFVMFCDICFSEIAFMILEKMVDSMILCWLWIMICEYFDVLLCVLCMDTRRCAFFSFPQEIAASYDVVDGPNDEGATVWSHCEEIFCWGEIGWACWRNEWKVPPGKLTWNLRITLVKRKNIFQTFIFGFHVKFWGCKVKSWWNGCCLWIAVVHATSNARFKQPNSTRQTVCL